MNWLRTPLLVLTGVAWVFVASCGTTDESSPAPPSPGAGGGGGAAGAEPILCDEYGGPDGIARIVNGSVLPGILSDCRLSPFFANLPPEESVRFSECMVIEFQTLFECDAISYTGAKASNGLVCRSLADAHQGLGVSAGDFSAFGQVIVQSLRAAGVSQPDIDAIGLKLLGSQPAIVSDPNNTNPTHAGGCPMGGEGGQGAGGQAGAAGAAGA